jgi:hypothetical protein
MQETENDLERLLRLAATEPAYRPEFYRLLLESTVFIVGSADSPVEGKVHFDTGSKVAISNFRMPDGSVVIPFFTSLPALQRAIEREERYLALPARALFELTRGATLFLNLRSEYGKEFLPQEIEALLAEGVNHLGTRHVIEKATPVRIGQPREYPTALVDSLTQLLSRHPNVVAAYVALVQAAGVDEQPHLLVAIEAEGEVEKVMREAGAVAADCARRGEPVDLMRIARGQPGSVSEYFEKQAQPFYERSWGARLKAFLRPGRA